MGKTSTSLTSDVWLSDDGIIHFVPSENATRHHTRDDAEKNIQAGIKLAENQSMPALFDIRKIHNITKDARSLYSNGRFSQLVKACALIVDDPVNSMIGNFFIDVEKPSFPIKMFQDEAEATNWLRQYA